MMGKEVKPHFDLMSLRSQANTTRTLMPDLLLEFCFFYRFNEAPPRQLITAVWIL